MKRNKVHPLYHAPSFFSDCLSALLPGVLPSSVSVCLPPFPPSFHPSSLTVSLLPSFFPPFIPACLPSSFSYTLHPCLSAFLSSFHHSLLPFALSSSYNIMTRSLIAYFLCSSLHLKTATFQDLHIHNKNFRYLEIYAYIILRIIDLLYSGRPIGLYARK